MDGREHNSSRCVEYITNFARQPITQAEQAVIEAARALCGTPYWRESGHFDTLFEAVRALDAPKPVRPEDVEPGVEFRFANPDRPSVVYRMIKTDMGNLGYIYEDAWTAFCFRAHDRIIPIAPE